TGLGAGPRRPPRHYGICLRARSGRNTVTRMRDVMAASHGRVGEVRVVFAGTPQAAVPSLNALMASRHEVCAVLTRPDAPSGRGRRLQPSPVAQRADELELEILTPDTPSAGERMQQ